MIHYRRGGMSRISHAAILVVLSVFVSSCQPVDQYQDQFWVISDSAKIYERPDTISKLLLEFKFGAEVSCREKNPSYSVAKGWVEAKSGEVSGFMEKRGIAGKEMYEAIRGLMDEAKDAAVQATGLTRKKASLRLKPEKEAFVIGRLKEPAQALVLERLVVTVAEKEKATKQVWYKIRLDDGRAGFVARSDLQLIPPSELNAYTDVRTPVSWYELGEKKDPATGEKGRDYLVTYSSVGSDVGADFTRVEIYIYDLRTKQYATALAKSGLYGKLPVRITDEGDNRKIIDIQEHPKGDEKKIHVMQYTYPSPIKLVKEYVVNDN